MSDGFEVYMHDVENAVAIIQVRSGETVYTDTYDLTRVYPGTIQVLALLGLELTEEAQLRAIDYVAAQVGAQLAEGGIPGDPVPNPIVENEPPAEPEPTEGEYVQEEPADPVVQTESLVPMPEVEEPVAEEEEEAP
jgi:hypothetical protein